MAIERTTGAVYPAQGIGYTDNDVHGTTGRCPGMWLHSAGMVVMPFVVVMLFVVVMMVCGMNQLHAFRQVEERYLGSVGP